MKEQINTEITTGYKMTELGPLPQEWKVVRLGEVSEISSGGSAPQGENYFNGDKPFIRVSHIDNEDFTIKSYDLITQEAVKDYKLKLFPKGTIVFPKTGATVYLEKRAMLPVDAYIVSHLCAVISNNVNNIQEFLFYVLKSKKLAKEKADGYPTLNLSEIKEIKIPLPPLPEQRKIAAILSTVQKAIETEKVLIERTKELKKSMMHKLFTEGIGWLSGAETSQKQTEIGFIPENWEVVRLGDCLLTNNDFRFSIDKENVETVCFIPMSLIPEENLFISQFEKRKAYEIRSGIVVYENDLLIAKITPCFENGKQGIVKGLVNGWGYATTEVIPIRVNDKINLKYIAYYFKHPKIRNFLASKMEGSTGRQRLPKSQIENLKIPLPPLPEQQQIADILSTIDQKIEHHTTKKQKLEELFRTLLHELMTARVRVDKINLDFLKMEE